MRVVGERARVQADLNDEKELPEISAAKEAFGYWREAKVAVRKATAQKHLSHRSSTQHPRPFLLWVSSLPVVCQQTLTSSLSHQRGLMKPARIFAQRCATSLPLTLLSKPTLVYLGHGSVRV